MSQRILLIGDAQRELHGALTQAMPAAQVVSVANFFDGIAELTSHHYAAVLASAEPIERRPESAVKTLRALTGSGRLLLFGHPTLEPLARKMLQFGINDYLVTPTTAGELHQMLGVSSLRLSDETAEESSDQDSAITLPPDLGEFNRSALSQLTGIPLADILLDSMLLSPNDAPAAAINQINDHIGPTMKLVFTANAAPALAAPDGSITLSQTVRANNEDAGLLHLLLPRDEDETAARHFVSQVAHLIGKTVSLQDRHNRLQRLAITDELTGLYNGRYFRHFLNRIMEKARLLRFPVTLLLFDIDNFKKYNDQFGHGVGDDILRQSAALMKKCVRDHDLVARISGDEFAVVFWEKEGPRQPRDPAAGLPGRPPQTPVQILERFRRLLATQDFTGLGTSGQGTLTISGGLAVYPYDAQDADKLIEAADKALMFKAKKSGKNSILLVGGQTPGTLPTP